MIGDRVRRLEDRRFLTGESCYTADVREPEAVFAIFVRSHFAHADIAGIDVAAAASAPGVIAVLTGHDYEADGLSSLLHPSNLPDHIDPSRGTFAEEELFPPLQAPPIVADRVRYAGEIVAMVVAETATAAVDAAELVVVDYEPLPLVTDARAALTDDAPEVWESGNLCARAERGDAEAVAAALDSAPHVVRVSLHNHRVHGSPMEPRSGLGSFDPDSNRYTLHAPSQGVHRFRASLAAALGVENGEVRVVTPDVGGGFGLRITCSNEYPLLLWAAKRCGRAVKWEGTRSEAFVADVHSRDVACDGALALDADGRVLGMQLDYVGNVGAHPLSFAVLANLLRMAGPPYDMPALHVRVRGVLTNTTPTSVYRGAGRPEVTNIVERLMDRAAEAVGIDRLAVRHRNLISADALPYRTRLGLTYDTGAFAANLDHAVELVDWDGFGARRTAAEARGKLAGIGIANYLESPGAAVYERADFTIRADQTIRVVIGTQASGQGHETSFAQVVAGTLGIPIEAVAIVFGDSDLAVSGSGSHADRSMRLAGTILVRGCEKILDQAKRRGIGVFELAATAPFTATEEISTRLHAHPTGAAACEVEIDPGTGELSVVRYVSVDDVGRAINPMIVEGQLHGGIAQGIGEAVFEELIYDPDTGQLLNGSFLDYGIPSSVETPRLEGRIDECPATTNPLGVKGAGEAGITPAMAVIVSATLDALRPFGITHLDTPLTPQRIWKVLQR
jgi:carbon-monoxide dehydrogenase large subunit